MGTKDRIKANATGLFGSTPEPEQQIPGQQSIQQDYNDIIPDAKQDAKPKETGTPAGKQKRTTRNAQGDQDTAQEVLAKHKRGRKVNGMANEKKGTNVSIWLTKQDEEKWKTNADIRGISLSALIGLAVTDYLERNPLSPVQLEIAAKMKELDALKKKAQEEAKK